MRRRARSRNWNLGINPRTATVACALAILLVLTGVATAALAQTYTVLHNFTGGADGGSSDSTLTMDKAGNLYGTAYYGGDTGANCDASCGTVFKMKPSSQGWVLSTLYRFAGGTDGANPEAGVVFGPDGTLYGTTYQGGQSCLSDTQYGCGTVFNLRPPAKACTSALCPWVETVLYRFQGAEAGGNGFKDGALPLAPVVFDPAGNLYGTTWQGGHFGGDCSFGRGFCGTVFELTPSNGGWTESLPWLFTGGNDGGVPESAVTLDAAGNLYGTAFQAGVGGGGVVFKLTPTGSGWTENLPYPFTSGGTGGYFPRSTPIFDADGNLYGTTDDGGGNRGGTVFQLTPSGGGWALTQLHAFPQSMFTGPISGLLRDSAGNLYGTGYLLGADFLGLVFELSPSNGGWTYRVLHQFAESDGCGPVGGVTMDAQGNLYGTASSCGPYGYGVVWEIKP